MAGQYMNLTVSGTVVAAIGPGTLCRVVVNKPVTSGVVTLYDGANAGATTKIGTIAFAGTLTDDPPNTVEYECRFNTGLVINSTAAVDLTVVYEGATAPAPLQVPNLLGWYDFSDPSVMFTDAGVNRVQADGNAIYQINDKSGTGRHLTRGGGAGTEPTYKVGIQNNRSIARFDGGDWLTNQGGFPLAATVASIIAVYKNPGGTTVYGAWAWSDNTNARLQVNVNNGDTNINTNIGTGAATYNEIWTAPPVGAVVHTVIVNNTGAVSKTYGNGVLVDSASGTPGISTSSSFAIGSRQSSTGAGLTSGYVGDFMELVIFNAELTDAQRQPIERYFASKWNIPGV